MIKGVYQYSIYKLVICLCLAAPLGGIAQIGGINTYEFLNLSPSARTTALGGNLITVIDDDAALALTNPAALNPLMDRQISFSHNFHLANIQNGFVNFAKTMDKIGVTFHGGIQYVNYGTFDETDDFGNQTGTFKAAEYALVIGAGKQVYDRLSVGANLKLISSQFAGINSYGVAADIAASYYDTSANFTATVLIKNLGTQLSNYEEDLNEALPFEVQIGFSKRLKYLPFRFSVIYHHFDRWNILYDDPNQEDAILFFGQEPTERTATSIWLDNFARHFIINGEFLFGRRDNFRLRFGYNHFMRQEMLVRNFGSFAGFSLGVGFKISKFRLDYGRTTFHNAGGVNHLTISTNLKEFGL